MGRSKRLSPRTENDKRDDSLGTQDGSSHKKQISSASYAELRRMSRHKHQSYQPDYRPVVPSDNWKYTSSQERIHSAKYNAERKKQGKRRADGKSKSKTSYDQDVRRPAHISRHDPFLDTLNSQISDIGYFIKSNKPTQEKSYKRKSHKESQKPLRDDSYRWCRLYMRWPRVTLGLLCLLHFVLAGTTGILYLYGYDVFAENFKTVPLDLPEDDTFLHKLAWENRKSEIPSSIVQKNVFSNDTTEEEEKSWLGYYTLVYFVPPKGENVFSKYYLEQIKKFEEEFASVQYYEWFCMRSSPLNPCTQPKSILRYFDNLDPNYENVSSVIHHVNKMYPKDLQYFLGKDSVIEEGKPVFSEITRSLFFTRHNDSAPVEYEQFLHVDLHDKLWELHKNSGSDIKFYFNNAVIIIYDLQTQVFYDLALAIGSFVFIFLFMWFQTASFLCTTLAIFSIVASFLEANLIYRFVLNYRYFGIFHVLSVFIILGIGADDVFVFLDAWKSTAFKKYPSMAHRLTDCYRRSAVSTLITSVTTTAAFLASWLSPLLAVSSFGIFSAILVMVNYVSVLLFVPAVIACYYKRWEGYEYVCCLQRKSNRVSPTQSELDIRRAKYQEKAVLVRFFSKTYFRVITHSAIKWIVIFLFMCQLGASIYFTTSLQADSEQVKILKTSNNYGMAQELELHGFRPNPDEDTVEVIIVWGLQKQNLTKCHKSDIYCTGETVYDNYFDLNPVKAQTAMREFCAKMRNLTEEEIKHLQVKTTNENSLETADLQCFLESMDTYFQAEQSNPIYQGTILFPASQDHVRNLMNAHPNIYNMSNVGTEFSRYFETAMDFWLQDGYEQLFALEEGNLNPNGFLGAEPDPIDSLPTVFNPNVIYGRRLRYAAIMVGTSLSHNNLGFEEGLPVKEEWDKFLEEQQFPASISKPFHTTQQGDWHAIQRQKELVYSAVQGIIIGLVLAFPILTLATRNLVISSLATTSIAGVTVSVVSMIPICGWKLGVLESINLCLIVGLAIDYVVHLAKAYHHSAANDRLQRTHYMLEEMGTSVLSGALTTLGASTFMLFTQILFFTQFGLFMFTTIFFSIIYALGFFTAIMSTIGPEKILVH